MRIAIPFLWGLGVTASAVGKRLGGWPIPNRTCLNPLSLWGSEAGRKCFFQDE